MTFLNESTSWKPFVATAVLLLSPWAYAGTAGSGAVTPSSPDIALNTGPYNTNNPTPTPLVDNGPTCDDSGNYPCDSYTLNVTLPSGYLILHPNASIDVSIAWTDPSGSGDYDLYAYNGDVSSLDGTQAAAYESASSNNPEALSILPSAEGTSTFTLYVVPYTASGGTVDWTIHLNPGPDPAPFPPEGSGIAPRFKVDPSPADMANSAGEPSLGFSNVTGRMMFLSGQQPLRVTYPQDTGVTDAAGDPMPEACDSTWEPKYGLTTNTVSMDPILFTEPISGRTFVSQLTGANSLFEYTDDDGDNYTQGQAGPPNGGIDHQTVGAGPYPANSPFAQIAAQQNIDYAVYYCSQSSANAFCARSDSGGVEFGPGVPIYTDPTISCGGLHGHVRVAPNGTVYVPNNSCTKTNSDLSTTDGQALLRSEDAGNTWTTQMVTTSTPTGASDPSVGIATDGTLYFCYVAADGTPHVSISDDQGDTWGKDTQLGQRLGLKNTVFAEATAGDSDRGACAFISTTTPGNYGALDFPGLWYGYIATTYDHGDTWHMANVTPGDPVQGQGGICTNGTTCGSNRNLLDFNDLTHDDKGRILFGFSDGCIGSCVSDPTHNSFTDKGTIVRQLGGRTLYSANDPTAPAAPAAPAAACLSGLRTSDKTALSWKAGDNGGDAITSYKIYRSTDPATFPSTPIGTSTKPEFDDLTQDPTVGTYYYRVAAVNSASGEGAHSNTLALDVTALPPAENRCELPGITTLTDAAGDGLYGSGNDDLLAFQIAQPYDDSATPSPSIVFKLKVADLSSLLPSSFYWVSFIAPDGTQTGKVMGVRMDIDASMAVTYSSYEVAADNNGGQQGQFAVAGSKKPLREAGYDAATGIITFVVDPANLLLDAPGKTLVSFNAGAAQLVSGGTGPSFTETLDAMPDGGARSGAFEYKDNAACMPNTPPVAALTANVTSGTAPLGVLFDGSTSSDADAGDTIASYQFDFGDGRSPVTQSTPVVAHSYSAAGNYSATLKVTDSRGLDSANTSAVAIEVTGTTSNAAPTPSLKASPTSGVSPLNVVLDGSGSSDSDGTVASYTFDFGDGGSPVTQSAASVEHTYTGAGTYTASLTVTDDQGLASSLVSKATITVSATPPNNQAPTASLSASPVSGTAPLDVSFDGSASSDPDGTVKSYIFSFGDNTAVVTSSTATITHNYSSAGTYAASLTVVDDAGATSSPSTVSVTVSAKPTTGGTSQGGGGGGAMGLGLLALLATGGILHRRRPR